MDTTQALCNVIYETALKNEMLAHVAKHHARGHEWFADYVTDVIVQQIESQLRQPMIAYNLQWTKKRQDTLDIDGVTHYYQIVQYNSPSDSVPFEIGFFDGYKLTEPLTLFITTCEL